MVDVPLVTAAVHASLHWTAAGMPAEASWVLLYQHSPASKRYCWPCSSKPASILPLVTGSVTVAARNLGRISTHSKTTDRELLLLLPAHKLYHSWHWPQRMQDHAAHNASPQASSDQAAPETCWALCPRLAGHSPGTAWSGQSLGQLPACFCGYPRLTQQPACPADYCEAAWSPRSPLQPHSPPPPGAADWLSIDDVADDVRMFCMHERSQAGALASGSRPQTCLVVGVAVLGWEHTSGSAQHV